MGRKGTRATAGHMPLTHYERTHKFAAEYGTQSLRLSAGAQYQVGTCALTTQSFSQNDDTAATALCSPSGYLYDETAILEYLLQQTGAIKRKHAEDKDREEQRMLKSEEAEQQRKKQKIDAFQNAQQFIKKEVGPDKDETGSNDLHRVSYWLSAAQPTLISGRIGHKLKEESSSDAIIGTTLALTTTAETFPPPERPRSPMTQEPLLRRDLWPVQLDVAKRTSSAPLLPRCAISEKPIGPGAAAVAYWTEQKPSAKLPGRIVLQSVYEELSLANAGATCPLTDRRIRHVRTLQRGGSSFAATAASGGQAIVSTQYTPTIT
jgi:Zinc-finger of nitric oxide synthase-interacting protein